MIRFPVWNVAKHLFSHQSRIALMRSPRLKLIRYAISGVLISIGYSITAIVLVDVLKWTGPALASALSFVLWTPVSYIVHRDFTFLFVGEEFPAVLKFALSFAVRLVAAAYTVHLATMFGLSYIVGVFANWIVLPLANYVILHLWVFRERSRPGSGPRSKP